MTTDCGQRDGDAYYFGWCPECGRNDGYLNVGRTHWFVCHAHRVRWNIGSNLFSSWRFEDGSTWDRNWNLIHTYREVSDDEVSPVLLEQWAALAGPSSC
jgi:hypothetical protein